SMRRIGDILARIGLAFAAIAVVSLISMLTWRLHLTAMQRVGPFLFLVAILTCSWFGGHISGISSVLFAVFITSLVGRNAANPQFDPYRLALLMLLAVAVSWIEAHRRHVEQELRAGVEQKTAQLQAAVEELQREVHDRRAAEDEIRRLNRLLEARVD